MFPFLETRYKVPGDRIISFHRVSHETLSYSLHFLTEKLVIYAWEWQYVTQQYLFFIKKFFLCWYATIHDLCTLMTWVRNVTLLAKVGIRTELKLDFPIKLCSNHTWFGFIWNFNCLYVRCVCDNMSTDTPLNKLDMGIEWYINAVENCS